MKFLGNIWSYLYVVIVIVSLVILSPVIYLWGWAHCRYQVHITGKPDPSSWKETRARKARKAANNAK